MTDATGSRRVVVGVDGSPMSKAALAWAVEEARARGWSVTALHAWQFPIVAYSAYGGTALPALTHVDLEKVADQTVREAVAEVVGDDMSVPVEITIVNAHPTRALVEESRDAELVVVGSRGHGGFAGLLLGSVSTYVTHHAECPVVVVR
jgi:nucleotide-binding universal stress UspA family protein